MIDLAVQEEEEEMGPYSVQSVGAAEAVSLAIGHNPGWVATPTQGSREIFFFKDFRSIQHGCQTMRPINYL